MSKRAATFASPDLITSLPTRKFLLGYWIFRNRTVAFGVPTLRVRFSTPDSAG